MPKNKKAQSASKKGKQTRTKNATHVKNHDGIVYVLSNIAMPGLVKIGYTKAGLDQRLKQLHTTAVPLPFKCEYACRTENYRELEAALHQAFQPQRVAEDREFFRIDADLVIPLMKFVDKSPDQDEAIEIDSYLKRTPAAIAAENRYKAQNPNYRFDELGIPLNSEIVLMESEPEIKAIVVANRKVEYDGEQYSLTKLTKILRGWNTNRRPLSSWTYKGRTLQELYNECYLNRDFEE